MSDIPDPDLETDLELEVNENIAMDPATCPRCGSALGVDHVTDGGKLVATCPTCHWPAAPVDS